MFARSLMDARHTLAGAMALMVPGFEALAQDDTSAEPALVPLHRPRLLLGARRTGPLGLRRGARPTPEPGPSPASRQRPIRPRTRR